MKFKINFKDEKIVFLLLTTVVPILLMLLTSMIIGAKIRTMWMTPFYLFFGVLLVYIFQSQINLNKLKSFVSVFLILFILSPFAYAYISITQTDKRTDYPGREIAKIVQNEWDKNFSKKIKFVYGASWDIWNLSYHLKSRPVMGGLYNYEDAIHVNTSTSCKKGAMYFNIDEPIQLKICMYSKK
jgi:hypothetical protein